MRNRLEGGTSEFFRAQKRPGWSLGEPARVVGDGKSKKTAPTEAAKYILMESDN